MVTSSCSGRQNPLQASAFPSQQSLLAALALRFRAFALGFACTATSLSCWPSKIRLHRPPGKPPAPPGPTHSQHEIPWPCRSFAVEAFRLQPWVPHCISIRLQSFKATLPPDLQSVSHPGVRFDSPCDAFCWVWTVRRAIVGRCRSFFVPAFSTSSQPDIETIRPPR